VNLIDAFEIFVYVCFVLVCFVYFFRLEREKLYNKVANIFCKIFRALMRTDDLFIIKLFGICDLQKNACHCFICIRIAPLGV